MFGTLHSNDFERGTLEFVENPNHVAAVSRNLRDNIHISCTFCRSRKIRCSGKRKRCQRCVALGLECVYPKNRGPNKRQEKVTSRRTAVERETNTPTRILCDQTEPKNGQVESGEDMTFDDLQDFTFDYSSIDESLFTPWIMDTPMQHSLDGSSSSRSSTSASTVDLMNLESSSTTRSRSATIAQPGQLPKISTPETPDTPLTSPNNSSTTDSAGNSDPWEEAYTTHSDISWAVNVDEHETTSKPERLSAEPRNKPRTDPESCSCLLSSISFLERLVSKSASRENRIDLLFADVRNSMETLAIFIACERCATQIEQNMLLAMALRQISVICGKTADCYRSMRTCGLDDAKSPKQKSELDDSASSIDIAVLTYSVSKREMLHMLESLVTFQIMELQQHINTVKNRYRNQPNLGQAEALVEAENHIRLAQVAISSHP